MNRIRRTPFRAARALGACCSLALTAGACNHSPSAAAEQEITTLVRLTATEDSRELTQLDRTHVQAGHRFQWQFATAESATTYYEFVEQRLPASYICDGSLSGLHCFRALGDEQLAVKLHAQTSRETTWVRVSVEVIARD